MKSIVAHCLLKNEEKWLWYSVTSVIDNIDRVLLWDTGSTDGSIEIVKELIKKYPEKVVFKSRPQKTAEEFTQVRQEMLDETKSDWFLILDADEIWWQDSIQKVVNEIQDADSKTESIVVPTINLVGDIFHFQEEAAGRYKFGSRVGHFNLRAVNKNIPGLHAQGPHGLMGWVDDKGKMIQDRDGAIFLNVPYLHATHLQRAGKRKDSDVIKRKKKLKYEIGESLPKDFYYPEVFFKSRPKIVPSPWSTMTCGFKFRAFFETPLRKAKRRIYKGGVGY